MNIDELREIGVRMREAKAEAVLQAKIELAENEIYLENYGGKIPFAEISAKEGTGVEWELIFDKDIKSLADIFWGNTKFKTTIGFNEPLSFHRYKPSLIFY